MKATTSLGISLAAIVVCAGACGGGSKKTDTAPADPSATAPVQPEAPPQPKGSAMGVGADAVRARSSFALYPKSTRIVGGVSVAQLRASAAWPVLKTLVDQRTTPEMKELRDVCKLDAVQVVDSIEVAMSLGAEQEIVLVVDGSFTRAGIGKCAPLFAKSRGHSLAVTDSGVVTSYSDATTTLWVGWPTENRAVFGGDEHDEAWLADRLGGRNSVRENEAFMEVVGNVDTSATAWFAIVDENRSMQGLAGFLGGRAPTAAFLSIRMADALKAEVGFVFETEGDAKVARTGIESMIDQVVNDPMVGPLVSTAHVGVYGANAVVELELNQEQFEKLIQMVPMLPF